MKQADPRQLISMGEAARRLGVTRTRLRQLIADGVLESYQKSLGEVNHPLMDLGRDEALGLVEQSLRMVDKFGARPIQVRDVGIADRTLVVQFDVQGRETTSVLGEIANVMGVLSGLATPDLFPQLAVDHYGARAFDGEGQELMWVVSSIEAASFIARGQPIEWLSRSLVQENTPGYRRSQADRRVGQIETALRDLLDEHGTQIASDYHAHLWDEKTIKQASQQARREGLTDEPRDLLDFVFLPQLVEAVHSNVSWFKDGCVPDPNRFKSAMTRLNKVRRKVAHHREISESDLQACRDVAETVLAPLSAIHPDLADDFLVDRWEDEVARIVAELQEAFAGISIADKGMVSEDERRRQVIAAAQGQLDSVEAALEALDRLVLPPQRRDLHLATVSSMTRWRDALNDLSAATKKLDITVAEAEAAREAYVAALAEVRQMRERIKAIRLGLVT